MKSLKFAAVPALKLKPYAITNNDGKVLYVQEAELIRLVSEYFRVPYEVLIPADQEYGRKLPNGNWTGMRGMLERSEADLAFGYIRIGDEIPPGVNFVYPHILSDTTFMGNKPEPLSAKKAIISPFSCEIWIMIALCSIVATFLLYFLIKKRRTFLDIFLNIIGSLLEKSLPFKIQKSSLRLLIFTWIFSVFVLTNSYKGVILSFLTFPTLVGIRDISELSRAAVKNSVKCYTYRGTLLSQRLIESKIDSWKNAGECLKRNDFSGVMEDNTMEEIFLNATGKKVFLGGRIFLNPYEKHYLISKDSFSVSMYSIYYAKKFCCPEYMNSLVLRLNEAGLIDNIRKKEAFFTERKAIASFPESKPSVTLRKINFSDISGAFFLLVSGWILGFLTLLAEIAVDKFVSFRINHV